MLEKIEARIEELTNAINQSLANHNALLGALGEAKRFLEVYQAIVTSEATKPVD